MSFPHIRPITISVSLAVAAMAYSVPATATQSNNRVALESVIALDPSRATPATDSASFVSADRIEGNPEEQLHLYGQAEIRRAGTVLKGDRITYTQATDEVQAEGNAKISRLGATFSGPSMRFKITPRTGAMNDAEYEYAPRNLRGCAKNIRFMSGDTTTFDEAKITTCKRDDEAWFITMNKLEIDEYDQTASGTGAVLNFMGLPIIGTPWFAFPISQERRSGFLVPTYGMSSTRGLDLTIPYYFNIAPNYDLTLTPRVMSKRGVMLDTQARFLYNDFSTVVDYSYLPDDRITKENRSSVHVDSQYRKDRLSARVNYNRVSDDDFITDFSGNIRESSETVLPQDYSVRYDETYWNTAINVQKNQTLDVNGIHSTKPYERVPQIVFNGYNGNWNGFELNTTLDATRFESPYMVNGDRFVFEQNAAYPFRGAGWFVVPKATFLGTWYQLRDIKDSEKAQFDEKDPHRTLPMFSIDSGLVFERDTTWFGRAAYQTLEPRIYYAWVPYRNQDNLPVFDTSIADLNFATLFSENLFSGYDRVSESNQLTTVLSTRYFDQASGLELFRASVGQRRYFSDQRVSFYVPGSNQTQLARNEEVRSDLLASVGARLTRSLTANVSGQYSSARHRFEKVTAGIRWQPKPMSLIGLYYRYNYSHDQDFNNYDNDYIKQVDFAVQWPLTDRLFGILRYNYSLLQKKPIEMIAGVEYLHDCWTLRFATQRYTTASNSEESNFFLQLELNGLGSMGTSPLAELKRNIKGYQTTTQVPDKIGQYDYYE